ncbi:MAG: hemerythrin domain-containing protein [Candidatus Neomarinimicrobiota bacterium]
MKKYDYRAPIFQEFNIDNEFYNSLSKKHIMRTLMEEHQVILNFCTQLEELVKKNKKNSSISDSQEILKDLQLVSGHLLRTEKHHIREEHTFVRRLVSMAEFEPSQEIRKQHDNLGVLKRKLERTIYGIYTTSFNEFQKELQSVSRKLIKDLKKHIDIEENILYPQAVKLITDKNRWKKMRVESKNIGYCCFTPSKQ